MLSQGGNYSLVLGWWRPPHVGVLWFDSCSGMTVVRLETVELVLDFLEKVVLFGYLGQTLAAQEGRDKYGSYELGKR